jgi:hypothetical protein
MHQVVVNVVNKVAGSESSPDLEVRSSSVPTVRWLRRFVDVAVNAPSGPDNPHILTVTDLSGLARPNVAVRIREPDDMPARTPQA